MKVNKRNWFLVFAACATFMLPSFAYSKESATSKVPEDLSFHGQCPKLFAMADDFAKECLEKARTWSYETVTDVAWNKITISQTVYFRQTDPKSHFSLGCILRNNDREKIDYIGVYYTANGNNFNIPEGAELRDRDRNGGVSFNVNGKPIYFVLVRPFVTPLLPFVGEDSGAQYFLVDRVKGFGRPKNCENVALPNGAIISKNWFVERTTDKDKITIKTCDNPMCNPTPSEEKHPRHTEYIKFFGGNDQQIIYGSFSSHFFIESGGGLLIRSDIFQMNCGFWNRFVQLLLTPLTGNHDGGGIVPHIELETCNLTPSSD